MPSANIDNDLNLPYKFKSWFIDCLNSEKYFPKIEAQIKDALNSGATGTPYSIVINANEKKYEINGALPIDDFKNQSGEMQKGVKSLIEEALK